LLVVRENDGENLSEKKMTEERETKLHEAARKKGPIQFGRVYFFSLLCKSENKSEITLVPSG